MKKNIYITTFQKAFNYGAVLQCVALQKKLSNYGNVEVINYKNKKIENVYSIFSKPTNDKNILKYIKAYLSGIYFYKKISSRNKNFEKYINNNINLTSEISKEDIINKKFKKDSILVTGSDQVWNTNITDGYDDIYFLNFGNNVKKISYAASIGTNNIDEKYEEKIKKTLNNYDAISVREETAKIALNKLTNKDIEVVLDPTLLLTSDDWKKHMSKERYEKEKYIFVYMPNGEVIEIANDISKKTGLKILYIFKKNIFKKNSRNVFTADPADFINLIYNAEYVVTSSFHATTFSVIFNKKFFVVPPIGLNSRIVDLLNKLKLQEQIITKHSDYINKNFNCEINYQEVNKILEKERIKSLNFIDISVKGGEK